MGDLAFKRLAWTGYIGMTCSVSYADTLMAVKYGGGYREDVLIGSPNGLRAWKLNYGSSPRKSVITFADGQTKTKAQYVWDFYCERKQSGNEPFVIRCPRDGKDYLVVFTDDNLDLELVDWFLASTGLAVEQVFVKGVNTLDDGSLGDSDNNAEI